MREMQWPAPRPREGLIIERPRLSVEAITGLGHVLISGDLQGALNALAPQAPLLGLFGLAPDGPYALRVARDSALLVTPAPIFVDPAQRGEFFATAVDDGFAVLTLRGTDVADVLSQGASVDFAVSSPSACVMFAGFRTLIVRRPDGVRLHLEASYREAMLEWLEGA